MQSTGHTSTQLTSLVPMHFEVMMRVMRRLLVGAASLAFLLNGFARTAPGRASKCPSASGGVGTALAWTPAGWLQVALVALAAVVAYELLRSQAWGWLRRRQERRVDAFLRDHRIPTDPFR